MPCYAEYLAPFPSARNILNLFLDGATICNIFLYVYRIPTFKDLRLHYCKVFVSLQPLPRAAFRFEILQENLEASAVWEKNDRLVIFQYNRDAQIAQIQMGTFSAKTTVRQFCK